MFTLSNHIEGALAISEAVNGSNKSIKSVHYRHESSPSETANLKKPIEFPPTNLTALSSRHQSIKSARDNTNIMKKKICMTSVNNSNKGSPINKINFK